METKTDIELKKEVTSALDSVLAPMHELERRGYTVDICTTTLQELNGDQPGCILNTTIFNLRVFKQTTEDL